MIISEKMGFDLVVNTSNLIGVNDFKSDLMFDVVVLGGSVAVIASLLKFG